MKHIKIKILPATGSSDGTWETIALDDFLLKHSPHLSMHVRCAKQFPPFHILNEELLSGGADLGMSGGSFWKPFEITEEEYLELREEMITSPTYNLEYDVNLENRKTIKNWCGAVISQHNPRKRENT